MYFIYLYIMIIKKNTSPSFYTNNTYILVCGAAPPRSRIASAAAAFIFLKIIK